MTPWTAIALLPFVVAVNLIPPSSPWPTGCCAPGSRSALDERVDPLEARVACAVEPGAAGHELARSTTVSADALAGRRADARREASDGFARDAADRIINGRLLGLAEERRAQHDRHLVAQRGPRADDRGDRALNSDPLDGLLEVDRQAQQRLAPLGQADEEDDRRLRRELGMTSSERRSASATS